MEKFVMTTFYPYQWNLNYWNPVVLNEMSDNMLYLTNRGIDIIRLNAVSYIWKQLGTACRNLPQVHNIVRIMRIITEIVCPGVLLLGEVVMEPSKVVPYFRSVEKSKCHYTANPGTTVQNNREYFQGLKDNHETKVSSHFVVGIQGEISQCISGTEITYGCNSRNSDTLFIECCREDETGEFTEETYISLVCLTGWLCWRYDLTSDAVIRHYDVTRKICPKFYVEHPEQWYQLKEDVVEQIKEVDKKVKEAENSE